MEVTPTLVRPLNDGRKTDTGKYKVHINLALTKRERKNLASHAEAMGISPEQLVLRSIVSMGFQPAWMDTERVKPEAPKA